MSGRNSVFVSYARRDGADLAQRLLRDLEASGFDVWLDTHRLSGGQVWTREIEQAIDRCDCLLAVLTKGSFESDICRAEQLHALRKGKVVIPLLGNANADVPLHLETKNYRRFYNTSAFSSELRLLVQDIRAGDKGVPLAKGFRTTHVTAPPLPRNYIPFPDAVARLRDEITKSDPGPTILLVALRGMGGIGKTVLAQALCHDRFIQNAFPDGVVWTTAGKEPNENLTIRLQEVRRGLGDEPSRGESELECINHYRTLVSEKASLIIVDDIWRAADIEPFLAESLRSRLLFTTRDASIAAAVGAVEHEAELPGEANAAAVMARWAGLETGNLPEASIELVRECGRLPLALSMIGAQLRNKPPVFWLHTLQKLQQSELPQVFRAVEASVDALEDKDRQRYTTLCALLDGMSASVPVLRTLWNTDESTTLETVGRFLDLSLAQLHDDTGAIALHEIQHDYIKTRSALKDDLNLIHDALRLSSHALLNDQRQFASQLVGRLLVFRDRPRVREFLEIVTQGAPRPWLRPYCAVLASPGGPLSRSLEANAGEVRAVAVSDDWRRAVSAHLAHSIDPRRMRASATASLRVWDLETGRTLHILPSRAHIGGVAVSGDGRRAVAACSDGRLEVWDLTTGKRLQQLKGHRLLAHTVSVSVDGHRAVSGSEDGTIRFWDLRAGRCLRTITLEWPQGLRRKESAVKVVGAGMNPVICVAMRADGKLAISGSDDGAVRQWDVDTGAMRCLEYPKNREIREVFSSPAAWNLSGVPLFKLNRESTVNCVAASRDWRRALSGTEAGDVTVWDLVTGSALYVIHGSGEVLSVALNADGTVGVGAYKRGLIKVWDLDSGDELKTLEAHKGWIWSVALSGDGKRAISASNDSTVKVWNLGKSNEAPRSVFHGEVTGLAVSACARRAVSTYSLGGYIVVWNVEAGEPETVLGDVGGPSGVAVRDDGLEAYSTDWGTSLRIWNLAKLKVWNLRKDRLVRTLSAAVKESSGEPTGIRLDPGHRFRLAVTNDGRFAISVLKDGSVVFWDVAAGKEVSRLEKWGPVHGVAIANDGRRAVISARLPFGMPAIIVWEPQTGKILRGLKGHDKFARGVAISGDGRFAATASEDTTVKIWNLETGEVMRTLEGHGAAVSDAAISANGKEVVSVSDDRTLRLWNLHTDETLIYSCDSALLCCAHQQDGYIAAGDAEGNIHFLVLHR